MDRYYARMDNFGYIVENTHGYYNSDGRCWACLLGNGGPHPEDMKKVMVVEEDDRECPVYGPACACGGDEHDPEPADDYDGPDAPDSADRDLAVEWGGLDIPS